MKNSIIAAVNFKQISLIDSIIVKIFPLKRDSLNILSQNFENLQLLKGFILDEEKN